MIAWLFLGKRTHRKPIAPYIGRYDQGFGWVEVTQSPWQSFWDDHRRYGLTTALYNIRKLWRMEHGR